MSGLRGHAVHAPVGLAIVVTDGDAEPPVVGSNNLDGLVSTAGHHQLVALAGVASADGRLAGDLAT